MLGHVDRAHEQAAALARPRKGVYFAAVRPGLRQLFSLARSPLKGDFHPERDAIDPVTILSLSADVLPNDMFHKQPVATPCSRASITVCDPGQRAHRNLIRLSSTSRHSLHGDVSRLRRARRHAATRKGGEGERNLDGVQVPQKRVGSKREGL